MKYIFLLMFIAPYMALAQSDDGKGTVKRVTPTEITESKLAEDLSMLSFMGEKSKYNNGHLVRSFQWFDYEDRAGIQRRFRREFKAEEYFYDELLLGLSQITILDMGHSSVTVQHSRKKIIFKDWIEDDLVYLYDGPSKFYDNGILQATLYFKMGRPEKIYINHYYTNGQLQFVREITSKGFGEPFQNTGVLEAYYPNGSVFENPITSDGTAIIILNDEGEPEDECACMGQNIMEWDKSFLYTFIGKYYYLLERIYQDEEMECCW